MSHFTESQLNELATAFGLKRVETLPVKDGRVARGETIWWRSAEGPIEVVADELDGNWQNIGAYPELYSRKKPRTRVQYLD